MGCVLSYNAKNKRAHRRACEKNMFVEAIQVEFAQTTRCDSESTIDTEAFPSPCTTDDEDKYESQVFGLPPETIKALYKRSRTMAESTERKYHSAKNKKDKVFKNQLTLMRKFYSWDQIPMEFFVDEFVDEPLDKKKALRKSVSQKKSSTRLSSKDGISTPINTDDLVDIRGAIGTVNLTSAVVA
mmetsp:Transcript_36032/g.57698  ORF Transcript_36032/g.57698 Transcript_36032/m.57698 type:complete len:185 (+) Transcript_36032:2471-3025(+)|eukprot:CAMPEP_0203789940 /NCGR_PEP_ID=MMETSP0100_2-20121128/3761_1 /ASSEMBLY_ACC=CAM_ASM_000210 /TAXON_ID=96639 /ORGANISM=" , Strain NY0313808BC1" /LENGTH=184 /DNA_ID=CAMNT_0050693009 /DNA_START=249 /DNA_END=803 /DNA_ORIENTATION=+